MRLSGKNATILGLATLAALAAPQAARAVAFAPQYTITLSGVFSAVDSSAFTGVSVGDAFTDTFTLPLDSPALLFSGPGQAIFRDSSPSSGDTITFDDETITPSTLAGHYAQLDTAIAAPPGNYMYPNIPPMQDRLSGSSDGSGAGQQYVQVSWSLSTDQYPTTHALTDNSALPLSGPGLSDITAWQNMNFSIQSVSLGAFASPRVPGQLRGTITSISATPAAVTPAVPESSSFALLALGLLPVGLTLRARRCPA